jgi:hypothetical protein
VVNGDCIEITITDCVEVVTVIEEGSIVDYCVTPAAVSSL